MSSENPSTPAAAHPADRLDRAMPFIGVGASVAIAATLLAMSHRTTVQLNMVDVADEGGAPRVVRAYRTDFEVSDHCDALRKDYENAVMGVLLESRPGATLSTLTPEQVGRIAKARKAIGAAPASVLREAWEVSPESPVAVLTPRTSQPQSNWGFSLF